MANYNAYSRTNYFRVTDSVRLEEIVGNIACEDTVELFRGSNNTYGFGGYGSIDCYYDEESDDYSPIYSDLQKILPDGEVCIIVEVGHEKLRYLTAISTVITNQDVKSINLYDVTTEEARKMINNETKEFQYFY